MTAAIIRSVSGARLRPRIGPASKRAALRPGGWVALLWNERDEGDPCTAAYGAVVRSAPDAAAIEVPRSRAGDPLLHSPLFDGGERLLFRHEQELDEEGLLGRAFSASYAPREPPEAVAAFAAALREVFARYQRQGRVLLRYETTVYLARRREFNHLVHDLVRSFGGSISAEHGIGRLRREELPRYKSALELALMRRLKRAFDPDDLMNPGKIFAP